MFAKADNRFIKALEFYSRRTLHTTEVQMTHNYTRLFYHFVWSTWDRTPLLVGAVEETAYAVIRSQCAEMEAKVISIGGIENHVHLLVSLPTTINVADFIKSVKGVSSRVVNQNYARPA
jgi:putative transposase